MLDDAGDVLFVPGGDVVPVAVEQNQPRTEKIDFRGQLLCGRLVATDGISGVVEPGDFRRSQLSKCSGFLHRAVSWFRERGVQGLSRSLCKSI